VDKLTNIIPFYTRMRRPARDWNGVPVELAHKRLQQYRAGEKPDDFIQALMEEKNGQANNSEWCEIVAEVSIMMNLGSATTAIAMTNVLSKLLKIPGAMKKVAEEIDQVLEDDEDESEDGVLAYDKVKHLPDLRACLDESLHLFPPTSHDLPRETPLDGISILSDYIPRGISVAMSAFVAHRIEWTFPQADEYIPERWLGEEGKSL
jgi:cytochrome P450